MNAEFAGGLVRGWVAFYTRGLAADVRGARSDEIESDLWSQQEEAGSTGRSNRSLAIEILARLVLGSPADLAWRVERGRLADRSIERKTDMSTKIVALLAIVGGLGVAAGTGSFLANMLVDPAARSSFVPGWTVRTVIISAGFVALSASLAWLGVILLDRYESPIGLVALCAIAAPMSLVGAYGALALLPGASVVAVLYLARIHAVQWSLALVHVASAPGLVLGLAAYSNHGLIGVAIIFIGIYGLTWMAIGLELVLRGLPQVRPAAPSAS